MANFQTVFEDGEKGYNAGLTTGIPALDIAIRGLQKKTSIGIASAQKVGKTTLADFAFVINPYLQVLKENRLDDVEWIYNSYEVDRINKEYSFAAHFFYLDYGISNFNYEGKIYPMSHDYLMGKELCRTSDNSIKYIEVLDEHKPMVKEIYLNRIVPIFGKYDYTGKQIQRGKITFYQEPDNPTGIRNMLLRYANQNGSFVREPYEVHEEDKVITKYKIIGYNERNPRKTTIVITDHVRKLRYERGFNMKQTMDKWFEYSTEFVNLCNFTMINIGHSNRNVSNVDRLKFAGETIYPTADDCKDSGNMPEESHIFLTMFNPNDEKYNLKRHFGVQIVDGAGNQVNPNYRSIHIADARYVKSPRHIQVNMFGNILYFEPFN